MKNIRHEEISRDSLYKDIEQNLDLIYALLCLDEGYNCLRFSVPILCAAKLEAFINVVGKLKVKEWDILERKLSFAEKCKFAFGATELTFDRLVEPNKTAIETFEIRNALVHPKMKISNIDEHVTFDEYERRSSTFNGALHHLRSELTIARVAELKRNTDEFVSTWGKPLLDDSPDYWLTGGSTGGYTILPAEGS